MRNTERMTISLPPEIAKQIEQVRRKEHRTRSELLRQAWRVYFESRYPRYTATKAELAAIRSGRSEFERGEYVTLDQLHNALATARNEKGTKRTRTSS